jgi:hypothetical protein
MSVVVVVPLRSFGRWPNLTKRRLALNAESHPSVPSFRLQPSAVEGGTIVRALDGSRSAKSWQNGESTQRAVAAAEAAEGGLQTTTSATLIQLGHWSMADARISL